MGRHALLQGIFLTQGLNPHLVLLLHWQVGSLPLAPPWKAQTPSLDHFRMKNLIVSCPHLKQFSDVSTILCGILPGLVLCHLPTSYACFSSQAQSSNLINCLPGPCPSCHREVSPDGPFFVILFHFLLTQVTLISPADLSSIITSSEGLSWILSVTSQASLHGTWSFLADPACQELVLALWLAGWAQHSVLPFDMCFRYFLG